MSHPEEKRRHPRIARRVSVRSEDQLAVDLETVDLSAGGLCCTASQFIPPMTKMALTLILPSNSDGKKPVEELVSGEAIVVRTDRSPSDDGGYRIALFFSRMGEKDRRTLHRFLQSRAR